MIVVVGKVTVLLGVERLKLVRASMYGFIGTLDDVLCLYVHRCTYIVRFY